jgi:hypothetical protein
LEAVVSLLLAAILMLGAALWWWVGARMVTEPKRRGEAWFARLLQRVPEWESNRTGHPPDRLTQIMLDHAVPAGEANARFQFELARFTGTLLMIGAAGSLIVAAVRKLSA